MWFITFSTKHPICKASVLNRCLIKVKTKTLQACLSQFCNHSCLLFIALYFQEIDISILAAITFISCWQLYRQPFSRGTFLTENINKKVTIIQIIAIFIIVYNSKQRKPKKFNRAFDQFEIENINIPPKIHSNHSYLLLLKY